MRELRRITERFRLEKRVSSQESGSVFRAIDTQTGETVALKLINAGDSEEQRDAFLAAAEALQGLRHPALPRIVDFGFTTAGSAFLATEYLTGTSFGDLAGAPPGRKLALLLLLVDGLEALAERGLPYRNLSAENLLVVPGPAGEQIKILGLGSTVFRPDGASADLPSDLRDFAVLASQMLGLRASSGPAAEVELPLEVAVELGEPEALRTLLDSALCGDPEGRYPGYAEVRRDLRRALSGKPGRRSTGTRVLAPEPPPAGSTAPLPMAGGWEEIRLGQEAPGLDVADATLAVERIGPSPGGPPPAGTMILPSSRASTAPAAAAPSGHETRLFRVEDLSPKRPPPSRQGGTLRVVPPPVAPTSPAGPSPAGSTGRPPLREEPPAGAPVPSPLSTGTVRIPLGGAVPAIAPETPVGETPVPRRGSTLSSPVQGPRPVPAEGRPSGLREGRRAGDTAELSVARPAPPPERLPPPPPPPPPVEAPPPAPPVEAAPPPPVPVPEPPPSPAVPAQASPGLAPRPRAPRPGGGRRLLLLMGVPAAVVALAAGGVALWLWQREPEPAPKPIPVRTAPPPRPAAPVAETPAPVHSQVALAESYLNAGDLPNAKAAIEAIPPEQIALFTSEDQDRYQRVLDALVPLEREKWAGNLARGLVTGDLRLLRAVVSAPPDPAATTPEAQRDLARAKRAVDADARLSRAQRSRRHGEALRYAALLLTELPQLKRAVQAREQAAAALEAEADAKTAAGQLEAALAALDELRKSWPDRPGLDERAERIGAERKADESLEAVLAAVQRAERENRPLDGLQRLAGVQPNSRYADRFRQARERLEAQFAQLDRLAPELSVRGPSDLSFEKGATLRIPLRITDDQGVKSAEAWARPEGGQFARLSVRQVSGSDYEIEIPPALHRNKTVDYYVTATDQSGHQGQLGSAQQPRKVKRKTFLDRFRGDKDKEGGEGDG